MAKRNKDRDVGRFAAVELRTQDRPRVSQSQQRIVTDVQQSDLRADVLGLDEFIFDDDVVDTGRSPYLSPAGHSGSRQGGSASRVPRPSGILIPPIENRSAVDRRGVVINNLPLRPSSSPLSLISAASPRSQLALPLGHHSVRAVRGCKSRPTSNKRRGNGTAKRRFIPWC